MQIIPIQGLVIKMQNEPSKLLSTREPDLESIGSTFGRIDPLSVLRKNVRFLTGLF